MNTVNKKIIQDLISIGLNNTKNIKFDDSKFLFRLSNGLCIIVNRDNVTQYFGGNSVVKLNGIDGPGIYSYGDGDSPDKTFPPRLLYRIMDVKKIGGSTNSHWERQIDKDLVREKLKFTNPKKFETIEKWEEIDRKYKDVEVGQQYMVYTNNVRSLVKILSVVKNVQNGLLKRINIEISPNKNIDYIEFDVETNEFLYKWAFPVTKIEKV